jgi:hypothetical protein
VSQGTKTFTKYSNAMLFVRGPSTSRSVDAAGDDEANTEQHEGAVLDVSWRTDNFATRSTDKTTASVKDKRQYDGGSRSNFSRRVNCINWAPSGKLPRVDDCTAED